MPSAGIKVKGSTTNLHKFWVWDYHCSGYLHLWKERSRPNILHLVIRQPEHDLPWISNIATCCITLVPSSPGTLISSDIEDDPTGTPNRFYPELSRFRAWPPQGPQDQQEQSSHIREFCLPPSHYLSCPSKLGFRLLPTEQRGLTHINTSHFLRGSGNGECHSGGIS